MKNNKSALGFVFLMLVLAVVPSVNADAANDDDIRQVVQSLLKKNEQLEARIRQLEQDRSSSSVTVSNPSTVAPAATTSVEPEKNSTTAQADTTSSSSVTVSNPSTVAPAATTSVEPEKNSTTAQTDTTISRSLKAMDKKIEELKDSASAKGLEMSGFFDVNAMTSNATEHTFYVGSVELDLDYAYDDHFGASTALVFNGSNGPGATGDTTFAVALVDYHLFDDRIPPRGRIFNSQGMHIQAGRFDLPFGTDYQNFAIRDRITATAPLTTTIMQMGGFNSEGVRTYGSWQMINYSAFWTDALYASDGHALGGRLGVSLAKNPYTVRYNNRESILEGIEFGVSHLSDLDGNNNIRNMVYGADLGVGYGMFSMQNEFMLRQAYQQTFLDADGNIVTYQTDYPIGKDNQLGYQSTLIADLEGLVQQPLKVYVRYSRWQPTQQFGLDFDGSTVAIDDISMLSVGLNYKFSSYLCIKLEYDDSLGSWTAERYFDEKVGIAQIVMAF